MGFTKYICYHCDTVFDEQDAGWDCEMIGEGSMRGPQWYNTCPNCGSDEYGEARECIACGEYFAEEDASSLDYCESCQNAIHELNDEHIEKVKEYFKLDYEDAIELIVFDLERRRNGTKEL